MLITFEGGEGSGKGTQIKLLEKRLKCNGVDVLSIIEPGGTSTGKAIREVLLNKRELEIDGLAEAFLFSASRAQQVKKVVRPALKKGIVILSDRSFYSTYAYQGYARGNNLETLQKLTEIAVKNTKPGLVLYLDVDPKIGIARKKNQNEINRLDSENLEFHNKVRAGYLKLAKEHKDFWYVIDASKSIDSMHKKIFKIVSSKL